MSSALSDYGLNRGTLENIHLLDFIEIKCDDDSDAGCWINALMDPRLEDDYGQVTLALPVVPLDWVRIHLPVPEITILPIPPISARDSTMASIRETEVIDDLTYLLIDVCRINARLKQLIEVFSGLGLETEDTPKNIIQDLSSLLQYYVSMYLDNEQPDEPSRRVWSGPSDFDQKTGEPYRVFPKNRYYQDEDKTRAMKGVYQICYPLSFDKGEDLA